MILRDFIKRVFSNKTNVQEKLSLGKLSKEQINEIQNQTGLNLEGYERVVENFGLIHIIKKHGAERIEVSRGQLPITLNDLELIPEITQNPDKIQLLEKSQRGGILIQFVKRIGNLFFYNEEIRTNKKELVTKTMFKRK